MSWLGAVSCVAVLLGAGSACAIADAPESHELTRLESPDARLRELDGGVKTSFDAMLERYAAEINAAPFDVVIRIDRCRFVEEASYEYEYAAWIDEAYRLAEQCAAELEADFPEHPERLLFALERLYGEERLGAARSLIGAAQPPLWTRGQIARLFALFAHELAGIDDPQAATYARYALDQDPSADVRLILARDLVEKGDGAEAVRTLAAPFDVHDPEDQRYKVEKMQLLAHAGAADAAVALHDELRAAAGYYDSTTVVDALLAVGEVERARTELERYAERDYSSDGERRRFYFEYQHGTPGQAFAAYQALRDAGWQEDPLGILRLSVQVRAPSSSVSARDWLGLAGFALAAAAIALVCAIPIALVHYRGLVRRARTNAPYPLDGWRLRDAWLASFLFGIASLVACYTIGPFDLVLGEESLWSLDVAGAQWARLAIVESALALVFLMPIAARGSRVQPRWWSERAGLMRWLAIAVLCALVLRLPLISAYTQAGDAVRAAFFETEIWQLLEDVRAAFGLGTTLWLMVVFAPVVEEFVFRGVMLRAFAAHLQFWSANLLQALIFAWIHMDAPAFLYLTVTGLVLGWLARRSGGLAAPMAMHAAFNGVAAAVAYA